MNEHIKILKRKIELKRQLILVTEKEIENLQNEIEVLERPAYKVPSISEIMAQKVIRGDA